MNIDAIYGNLEQMKEIVREMYIFTNQLIQIHKVEQSSKVVINTEEKKLLEDAKNHRSQGISCFPSLRSSFSDAISPGSHIYGRYFATK